MSTWYLRFKLWLIEKALRHHFGGRGLHWLEVAHSARVEPRRAQAAVRRLTAYGVYWPAVQRYPDTDHRWLHAMTSELVAAMPFPFDGWSNYATRATLIGLTAYPVSLAFGLSQALLFGICCTYPLLLATEHLFSLHREQREFLEEGNV